MEIKKQIKSTVLLYVGCRNVLVDGERVSLSENPSIKPYFRNNRIMFPVAFIADTYCAIVTIDGNQAIFSTDCGNHVFPIEFGLGDAYYCDLAIVCKDLNLFFYEHSNGIAGYSTQSIESFFDWSNNIVELRRTISSFIYDSVSGHNLVTMVKQKNPSCRHPRLMLDNNFLNALRRDISSNTNQIYRILFQNLKKYANRYLESPPSKYEIRDGVRLLYVCNENKNRILVCSLMYLLTNKNSYAECAYETMLVCANYKDWNPYHFLDVGTLAGALGIGYDWLYNWMNESQRELIRRAIVEKAFIQYMDDLDNLPRSRSWNWRKDLFDNWCMIISGECVAGLAICDELNGYELECAERAMQYSLIDIGKALMLFIPNGAYEEGPGYWNYAMSNYVLCIKSLLSATGRDFGYIDVPGMRWTNQYLMAVNGSVRQYNYHDKVTLTWDASEDAVS